MSAAFAAYGSEHDGKPRRACRHGKYPVGLFLKPATASPEAECFGQRPSSCRKRGRQAADGPRRSAASQQPEAPLQSVLICNSGCKSERTRQ